MLITLHYCKQKLHVVLPLPLTSSTFHNSFLSQSCQRALTPSCRYWLHYFIIPINNNNQIKGLTSHFPSFRVFLIDHFYFIFQVSLFLKDSWISTLRNAIRTSLRDVGKGWFNIHEKNFQVYEISKLKKLMEMVKFIMQVRNFSLIFSLTLLLVSKF